MSFTAAKSAAPAGPPPLAGRLDDFSDRLSPMLVKELRQGLRAKTFVIVFLALQALLTFVLLIAISTGSSNAGHLVSSVIFFFFSLAVLIVQPLRGIGSLHNEIRGDTIDLMVLTRMGTWRIVLGKWVAIVSQSGLLLAAIVPYLILRYFFGEMDLFAELLLLGLVFLGSAVFTAITIGLSALPSIVIRGLLPLFMAMFVGIYIWDVIFDDGLRWMISFCSLTAENSGWSLLAGVVTAVYLAWSTLALGASAIAPMAENHSSIRRLISLGSVILVGLLAYAGDFTRESIGPLITMFCAPAIMIALTEQTNLLPPVTRPFLRFGGAGRLAGRMLYPGWPAGVIFTGALVLVALGMISIFPSPRNGELDVILIAALGTLLFPAVVLRLLEKKVKNPFAFYLFILAITVAIAFVTMIIRLETEDSGFIWFLSWIPPVQVVLIAVVNGDYASASIGHGYAGLPDFSLLLKIGITTAGTCFALLLGSAFRNFRAIREVEDEATTNPMPTP